MTKQIRTYQVKVGTPLSVYYIRLFLILNEISAGQGTEEEARQGLCVAERHGPVLAQGSQTLSQGTARNQAIPPILPSSVTNSVPTHTPRSTPSGLDASKPLLTTDGTMMISSPKMRYQYSRFEQIRVRQLLLRRD